MINEKEVIIASAVRTAIGTYGGELKAVTTVDLAAGCVSEAVSRAGVESEAVGHTVFGNVVHSEPRDAYLARCASILGGLPESTPALTVNRLCGSGLQAIVSASQGILLSEYDCAVAGGAENMSRVPYYLPGLRWGQRMGDGQAIDGVSAALHDPFGHGHMGCTGENLAQKYGISREEQDALAVESHHRAAQAWEENRFAEQIVPVEIKSRKGVKIFDRDEHFRADASLEGMASLRTAFQKDGTVTAGNASGINDAAAALVLMERQAAEDKNIKPLARLVGYAYAGVDPKYMGIGPVPAVRSVMEKTGLSIADMDTIELNEAFAAQALAVIRELDLPMEKTNPNGSGISLGHPIGATGAIITVKALHELQRIDGRYALITMCIGGGQGNAAIIERL
ncbi:MAG: acetyl-CoA C-acyltransferase family protein [Gammaproteobacteria bacterium]|nr:acetyl-CoA C-acyltransferase family protein [Gammaproteobacteria bacterium]